MRLLAILLASLLAACQSNDRSPPPAAVPRPAPAAGSPRNAPKDPTSAAVRVVELVNRGAIEDLHALLDAKLRAKAPPATLGSIVEQLRGAHGTFGAPVAIDITGSHGSFRVAGERGAIQLRVALDEGGALTVLHFGPVSPVASPPVTPPAR